MGVGLLTHPNKSLHAKKGGGALFSSTHENRNPWGEGGSVPITLISLFVYFLLPQFFNTPKTTSW